MTSQYEHVSLTNIFQLLDRECSLCVLGFCLASHDIAWHRTISDTAAEPEERDYHFAVSLSILREIAKAVGTVDKLASKMGMSQNTRSMLDQLKQVLQQFGDDSLVGGALKPIRDSVFHYDFTKVKPNMASKIDSILTDLTNQPQLAVRSSCGDHSILRNRYSFADIFRHKLVHSYLTSEIVNQIATAACNVIAFTDSLLADLVQEHCHKQQG